MDAREGPSVRVVIESDTGARFEVGAAGLVIGRADGAEIRLDDRLVSREHARISEDTNGGVVLEDLRSTNGTYLNGSRVEGPHQLRPGDTIEIGGTRLRVAEPGQPDATSAMLASPPTDPARAAAVDPAALLEEAKRLYGTGQLPASEAAFRSLLAFPGHAGEAQYGLGLIALNRGRFDDAVARFHGSLERDPGHANSRYQLGVVAERRALPDEAVSHYRSALASNPAHAGAKRALSRLTPAAPAPPVPPAPAVLPEPDTLDAALDVGGVEFGVYEYLRNDKSPLSRQALAVMEAVRVDRRPWVSAFLGQILLRVALFATAAAIAAVLTSVDRIDLGSRALILDLPAWAPVAVLLAGTIPILWRLAVVLTMRIRIDKGRLQMERGILTRKITNLELWRITDVDLEQGFWNRLTGDGTIVLAAYQEKKPVRVTGLARGPDLKETYQHILNLAFLLRSNPIVKGIIT